MNHKTTAILLGCVLAVAGFAAGVLYGSNLLTGHVTVDSYLSVSGMMPTTFLAGQNIVSPFYVESYSDSVLSVYLVMTATRTGITPTDISVTIAGNPISASCIGDICSYSGSAFTLQPRERVQADIGVTFTVAGEYDWTVQAWGSG